VTTPHREAYPLCWPVHVKRTRSRLSARFHGTTWQTSSYTPPGGTPSTYRRKTVLTIAAGRDGVLLELDRLGARDPIVISTNLRTRNDGLPASNQREPQDPGVAVYFLLDGRDTCIAIDRFDRVADNLRAVAKTIEAMRGIERWGGASLVAAAFTGFQALPGPGAAAESSLWWVVLGVNREAPTLEIERRARDLRAAHHPDKNPGDAGAHAVFVAVGQALDEARRERGEVRP
jgi:hypothetical protein